MRHSISKELFEIHINWLFPKGPTLLNTLQHWITTRNLCPFYKIRTTSVPPSKMKLKNPNYMLLSNLSVGSWFHLNNISFIETFEKAKITTFMIPCSSSYPHCTGRAVIKVTALGSGEDHNLKGKDDGCSHLFLTTGLGKYLWHWCLNRCITRIFSTRAGSDLQRFHCFSHSWTYAPQPLFISIITILHCSQLLKIRVHQGMSLGQVPLMPNAHHIKKVVSNFGNLNV